MLQDWNEEDAEEIRKLYLTIMDDPCWDSVQEDMTRMAVRSQAVAVVVMYVRILTGCTCDDRSVSKRK